MKPIEPGCLVMVTHPDYFGFTTNALAYLPEGEYYEGIEITSPVWVVSDTPRPSAVPICEHKYLIRIDDYDALTDEAEQDQEINV